MILEVKELEKYYGKESGLSKVLKGLNFEISKGEFVGIMGASGSGKTTLLNCISTIDESTSGSIIIDGEDITKLKGNKLSDFRKKKLGFVFQDFNLLDTLTVYENIALALTINKESVEKIRSKISAISKKLGIEEILEKYPNQISGGQKQRVATARAIVKEPAILMADEPTGALDSKSARQLLECFENLNKDIGTTIIMVTHDMVSASYCSRIIFIKDGEIFTEIIKGDKQTKVFYEEIIEVVGVLGGVQNNN